MPTTPLNDLIAEFAKHGVSQRRAETAVGKMGYDVSIRQFRELYRPLAETVRENRRQIVQAGYGPKPVADSVFSDNYRGRVQFLGVDRNTGKEGVFYRAATFSERQPRRDIVSIVLEGLTQESLPGSDPLDIAEGDEDTPTGLIVGYEEPGEGSQVL